MLVWLLPMSRGKNRDIAPGHPGDGDQSKHGGHWPCITLAVRGGLLAELVGVDRHGQGFTYRELSTKN